VHHSDINRDIMVSLMNREGIFARATLAGHKLPGTFMLKVEVSNGFVSYTGDILIEESELEDMANVVIPVLVEQVVQDIKNLL